MLRLASGINAAVAQICAGYQDDELEAIANFLRRTADAGRTAAEELDASCAANKDGQHRNDSSDVMAEAGHPVVP